MVALGGPVAYYGRASASAHAAHSRTEHMNDFFDNVSRILATPMPRRKAMKLFGGALAAAVVAVAGIQPLSAAACPKNAVAGSKNCGSGSTIRCCPPGTCCATNGSNVSACCPTGTCVCNNGTCSASTTGACAQGCKKCSG